MTDGEGGIGITEEDLFQIARYVEAFARKDFETVFLSHNLADTIWVSGASDPLGGKSFKVHIPATKYDINEFRKTGAVIHTPEFGSYAQLVDVKGGFSKEHRRYVERAVEDAIMEWASRKGYSVEIRSAESADRRGKHG